TIKMVNYNFDKYELGEASKELYNFVWDDFASWYVEISKVDLNSGDLANQQMTKNVLVYVLKAILKMLHPFCPFITEELYQALPHKEASIMVASWPKVNPAYSFKDAKEAIDDLTEIIVAIRNERSKANKAPSKPIRIYISCKNKDTYEKLESARNYLIRFTNPTELGISLEERKAEGMVVVVLSCANLYIPTEDLVDVEEAKMKLLASKEKLEKELARSKAMLSNPSFIAKAPAAKIEAEQNKLKDYEAQYEEVCAAIAQL
ncbi:MAG: class I tRNA ligase family protein, partial [Anaeroplasmataceae bacterium]|nr:class I tRNA ligase family protein [Anaeroplasmataceae bacterium]